MSLTRRAHSPLVLSWDSTRNPLPTRVIANSGRSTPLPLGQDAPPWIDSGPRNLPFQFCNAMQKLCEDISQRSPAMYHLDVSRILFGITQARNSQKFGLQARVTPLRFEQGSLVRYHREIPYQVQRFVKDGRDMLYVVAFCLPRFLNRSFDDKMVTIFHELYHISPFFDGDLRRHEGRYAIHTSSQKRYDQEMAEMAREYLMQHPQPAKYDFLRLNAAQLTQRHGSIVGVVPPRPKLIPLQ